MTFFQHKSSIFVVGDGQPDGWIYPHLSFARKVSGTGTKAMELRTGKERFLNHKPTSSPCDLGPENKSADVLLHPVFFSPKLFLL